MKYLHIEQNSQEWFDFRYGKLTGSEAKLIKPLSRGADRTPAGFWKLLAHKLAMKPDGEDERERGHRLETIAITEYALRTGKPFRCGKDVGVWVSDEDDNVTFSPDGDEPTESPTYSAEVKALGSDKHIKAITKDLLAKKKEEYNPIYSVPEEIGAYYRDQATQAFVVNELLEEHHFLLYDDRMAFEELKLYALVIKREHVQEIVDQKKAEQAETWLNVRRQMAFLIRELGIEV
jgi:hypothetical protein